MYSLGIPTIVLVLTLLGSLSYLPTTFVQASVKDEPFTLNHRLHVRPASIWIMGEVINNLGVSVKNISVKATFYDDYGHIIKEVSTPVWLTVLLPERRGPFIVLADEKEVVEGFSYYTVDVVDYQLSEDKPIGLTITNPKLWSRTSTDATVKGVIKNVGSKETNFILVIVYFYDTTGFLALESTTLSLEEGLVPGGSKEFDIVSTFVNESSSLVKYILTAESAGSPGEIQRAAYAIDQEIIKDLTTTPDQNIYYNIIAILVLVSLGIAVAIAIRKKKRRPHLVRRRISGKRGRSNRHTNYELNLLSKHSLKFRIERLFNKCSTETKSTTGSALLRQICLTTLK